MVERGKGVCSWENEMGTAISRTISGRRKRGFGYPIACLLACLLIPGKSIVSEL